MNNIIDLHIHSTASDGIYAPEKILQESLAKNLRYISLTDHESLEGFKLLESYKNDWSNNLTIIPGIELHTYYKNNEIHLLGYFLDYNDQAFANKLKELRQGRTEISYYTVENINKQEKVLDWNAIIKNYPEDVAITKAHIIQTIKALNLDFSYEKFYKYFHKDGEKYIPFSQNSLEVAINDIRDLKGIPVLAHPGLIGNDNLVEEIIAKFKIGVEVYYHYFGDKAKEWIEKYKKIAENFGVIQTGGTDFHGYVSHVEIGDTYIPLDVIEKLMKAKKNI